MVKFYIIFKDYFAFQERKLGKKEVVAGILLMAGIAFFMADCHSDINPLFVYVPFVILEGWILFHAPFFKFVICSLFAIETVGCIDSMSNILVKTMMTLCRYKGTYLEEGISCCITVLFLWGIKELLLRKSRESVESCRYRILCFLCCWALQIHLYWHCSNIWWKNMESRHIR